MICACCGGEAGRYRQWHNRDKGFGVCRKCVDRQIARGVSAEEIEQNYGIEGINYEAKKDDE